MNLQNKVGIHYRDFLKKKQDSLNGILWLAFLGIIIFFPTGCGTVGISSIPPDLLPPAINALFDSKSPDYHQISLVGSVPPAPPVAERWDGRGLVPPAPPVAQLNKQPIYTGAEQGEKIGLVVIVTLACSVLCALITAGGSIVVALLQSNKQNHCVVTVYVLREASGGAARNIKCQFSAPETYSSPAQLVQPALSPPSP